MIADLVHGDALPDLLAVISRHLGRHLAERVGARPWYPTNDGPFPLGATDYPLQYDRDDLARLLEQAHDGAVLFIAPRNSLIPEVAQRCGGRWYLTGVYETYEADELAAYTCYVRSDGLVHVEVLRWPVAS